MLDLYRMDPRVWRTALVELHTLMDRQWIEGLLIDVWLLDLWNNTYRRPAFRYLPTTYIQPAQNARPTDGGEEAERRETLKEIKNFRSLFDDLPQSEEETCALEDCICVVNGGGNHYFTVVFMPRIRRVHVLGRRYNVNQKIKGTKDWAVWGGHTIWARICELYGWPHARLTGMTVHSVDWIQNGYDCGPIACQVVENIWVGGLPLDGDGLWKRPGLPCCHSQRLNMATKVHQTAADGHRSFLELKEIYREQIEVYFGDNINAFALFEDEVAEKLIQHPRYALKPIEANLRRAIIICPSCNSLHSKGALAASTAVNKDSESLSNKVAKPQNGSKALLRGTRSKNDFVRNSGEGEVAQAQDVGGTSVPEPHKESSDSESETEGQDIWWKSPLPGAFQVADWTEAKIGRYPRPKDGPEIPARRSLRGLRHPFSEDYDDYTNGPTLDVLDPIPETVMQLAQLSLVYIANRVITCPWTLFLNDYGYRLLADFLQIFFLTRPILVREHLAPVGLLEPPAAFMTHDPPQKSRSGRPLITANRTVLGATELLDVATEYGSDLPLLTGMTPEDCYIYLDLERDRVIPSRLSKACDIDSFIWVTREPRFIGNVGIYEMPVIRKKPPIWKNNHIMVELLYPQSEDDKLRLGPRTEWQTKPFRLSRIPHLSFGVLNQTTSIVELLMFFPRMTHQHPHTHRWENAIPPDVQNFFWDRVLLPAWEQITTAVQKPYTTFDREHTAYKVKSRTGKNVGQATAKHPLHTKDLTRLIEAMKEIVGASSFLPPSETKTNEFM